MVLFLDFTATLCSESDGGGGGGGVNLKCMDAYAVLEKMIPNSMYIFATKHKANT
jgi:hypothetical protein